MRLKLYVVHGSHPCAAVEKALSLKGLQYDIVEWPPVVHAGMQRAIFGRRTVPGLRIDGTEKISGSRAIMRRLEQFAPEPPLLPADPEQRKAVEDAERWGDEIFQPLGRTLVWSSMRHRPDALVSYAKGSKLPLPAAAIRMSARAIARAASALNSATDSVARRDLEALPGYLDKIDAWIEDGTIGDPERPNVADLQLASTIRLLMTVKDLRPLIEGRPSAELAMTLFPDADGELPAGAIPPV
jgi:glutathione S-transferase